VQINIGDWSWYVKYNIATNELIIATAPGAFSTARLCERFGTTGARAEARETRRQAQLD